MRLLYLASPYSHKKTSVREKRFKEITKIAANLKRKHKNVVFFLPITQSHTMKQFVPDLGYDFAAWAKDDLYIITEHAKEVWVVLMKGWRESVGVQAEITCANYLQKKVRYIDPKSYEFVAKKDLTKY